MTVIIQNFENFKISPKRVKLESVTGGWVSRRYFGNWELNIILNDLISLYVESYGNKPDSDLNFSITDGIED